MKPKFTPDEQFRKMWTNGVLVADIAAHYGVSRKTITRSADRMGLDLRTGCTKLQHMTPEQKALFKAAWLRGIETEKMAHALGISRAKVSAIAMRHGLPKRKPGPIAHGSSHFAGCEA